MHSGSLVPQHHCCAGLHLWVDFRITRMAQDNLRGPFYSDVVS